MAEEIIEMIKMSYSMAKVHTEQIEWIHFIIITYNNLNTQIRIILQ